MRLITLTIILSVFFSCTSYRLHVRLNGQPTQSMVARIEKANGIRIVDLLLPGGTWVVSATESDITPRIIAIAGQQHVRFKLPPDRMLSLKPVELTLQGLNTNGKPSGEPFTVVIDYYNRTEKASSFS